MCPLLAHSRLQGKSRAKSKLSKGISLKLITQYAREYLKPGKPDALDIVPTTKLTGNILLTTQHDVEKILDVRGTRGTKECARECLKPGKPGNQKTGWFDKDCSAGRISSSGRVGNRRRGRRWMFILTSTTTVAVVGEMPRMSSGLAGLIWECSRASRYLRNTRAD